jgi:hypothetical protein
VRAGKVLKSLDVAGIVASFPGHVATAFAAIGNLCPAVRARTDAVGDCRPAASCLFDRCPIRKAQS